jgi:hypothetical protein
MLIHIGKHAGKSVEVLVLRHPDYVSWVLGKEDATGELAAVRQEAIRLVRLFDRKPFVKQCQGKGCHERATRCSVRQGSPHAWWWCAGCNPTQFGAWHATLELLEGYGDAINYVQMYCRGRKVTLKVLITSMARAKGAPERVGAAQAMAFFSEDSADRR